MTILAVDTACGVCSVALADMNGNIIASEEEPETSRQAECIVPMMQEILTSQDLAYADLSLLTSTIGPGSFTGLRIGMTAIKGTALVTGLPSLGVTTLEAIAASTESKDPLLVLLNAMRGQVYAQHFSDAYTADGDPALIAIEDIPDWESNIIAGNCTALVQKTMPEFCGTTLPDTLPHATTAAKVAAQRFHKTQQGETLHPLYIRKPDAKPPKPVAPL